LQYLPPTLTTFSLHLLHNVFMEQLYHEYNLPSETLSVPL